MNKPAANTCANNEWGPESVECPRCGEADPWGEITTRNLFECYECGYQDSPTAGTRRQTTRLDRWDWFLTAHLIPTTKKGISSKAWARKVEVTPTTAYVLQQQLACTVQRRDGRALIRVDRGR
jgi:Zn ribbon nucleic-acid-binding protein